MGHTKSDLYGRILELYPEITRRRISISLIPTSSDEIWTVRLKTKRSEVIAKILGSNLAIFTEGAGSAEASLRQLIAWMD